MLLEYMFRPDQSMDILQDFIYQLILNKPVKLHFVSYELNNHIVNVSEHFRFFFSDVNATNCDF